jgi:hypothetical protein
MSEEGEETGKLIGVGIVLFEDLPDVSLAV